MTPDQGFVAARAPAERVAFSTKRKAMVLPSGDHARDSMPPVTWVTCFDWPVFFDQRKTWSCPEFCSPAVQVDWKASHSPSGDQTGPEFPQPGDVLGVAMV